MSYLHLNHFGSLYVVQVCPICSREVKRSGA
jgi:hypothetical protein